MGTQLIGKTLGVVGLGRIGMAVARRAQGLKMKVIAYDPVVSQKTAEEAGIEYVSDIKGLFARSDYITLHVPVTDQTKGMVNTKLISTMKPNAVIINVARGAVINDDDLYAALEQKKIAGAALDVFAEEPPNNRGFEKLDNCLVTPHLGASTAEAQVVVAVDAAQELVEALQGTQMRNALNAPGLDKTLPDIVKQYCSLAERLGMVISTLAPGTIKNVEVTYRGEIASQNTSAVTTSFSVGLLQNHFEEPINAVNVHLLAKQCGLSCDEIKNPDSRDFASTIAVRVVTDQIDRRVTATIIGKNIQRIIAIDDYALEVTPEGTILIAFYDDKPGVIGSIGTICGKHNINIGTMGVGRLKDKAVLAVSLDEIPTDEIIAEFKKQVSVQSAFVCQLPTGN